jgi:ribosomal-protein-alanine N-acetyltransferase
MARLDNKAILLEVRASNTRAAELYKNRGFSVIGYRPGYYQAGEGREDAIVMRMELASAADFS